jgi:hypothetical protein
MLTFGAVLVLVAGIVTNKPQGTDRSFSVSEPDFELNNATIHEFCSYLTENTARIHDSDEPANAV